MSGWKKEREESRDKVQYVTKQNREDCQTIDSCSLQKSEQKKKN